LFTFARSEMAFSSSQENFYVRQIDANSCATWVLFACGCLFSSGQSVGRQGNRVSQRIAGRGCGDCCTLPESSGGSSEARGRLLLVQARRAGRDDNATTANRRGAPDLHKGCSPIRSNGLSQQADTNKRPLSVARGHVVVLPLERAAKRNGHAVVTRLPSSAG
jgi:hypothetical protein